MKTFLLDGILTKKRYKERPSKANKKSGWSLLEVFYNKVIEFWDSEFGLHLMSWNHILYHEYKMQISF